MCACMSSILNNGATSCAVFILFGDCLWQPNCQDQKLYFFFNPFKLVSWESEKCSRWFSWAQKSCLNFKQLWYNAWCMGDSFWKHLLYVFTKPFLCCASLAPFWSLIDNVVWNEKSHPGFREVMQVTVVSNTPKILLRSTVCLSSCVRINRSCLGIPFCNAKRHEDTM